MVQIHFSEPLVGLQNISRGGNNIVEWVLGSWHWAFLSSDTAMDKESKCDAVVNILDWKQRNPHSNSHSALEACWVILGQLHMLK